MGGLPFKGRAFAEPLFCAKCCIKSISAQVAAGEIRAAGVRPQPLSFSPMTRTNWATRMDRGQGQGSHRAGEGGARGQRGQRELVRAGSWKVSAGCPGRDMGQGSQGGRAAWAATWRSSLRAGDPPGAGDRSAASAAFPVNASVDPGPPQSRREERSQQTGGRG